MPVHREKQWEKYCGDENPRASETSVTEYFPVSSISFAWEMRAVLMALLRLVPAALGGESALRGAAAMLIEKWFGED